MAYSRDYSPRKKKESIIEKADVFTRPTILINCIRSCSACSALYPYITASFKAFCSENGFDVHVTKDDAIETANYYKYGKPNHVGGGTPQIYAINGDKVTGTSPSTMQWTASKLISTVEKLMAKVK